MTKNIARNDKFVLILLGILIVGVFAGAGFWLLTGNWGPCALFVVLLFAAAEALGKARNGY